MAEATLHPLTTGRLARWWCGLSSLLRLIFAPFGSWWCRSIDHLATDDRSAKGLVIVLPGIEGRSTLNIDIAQGLADGGVRCAVEVHDWTTARLVFAFYHLRSGSFHAVQAVRLAKRITDYQDEFPGRPVVLVGHSGGAALILQTLPLLGDRKISGAVLLAVAVSSACDTTSARRYAVNGFWSFHSPFDWFQLGLGTLVVGTFDGKYGISAGMLGFRDAGPGETAPGETIPSPDDIAPLRQIRYRFAMLKSWHFGGHWGYANRLFAAEWLGPIVIEACQTTQP
jgi:hypothetical protein